MIKYIPIRIKADIINSIALETCWFNNPGVAWRLNDTMPMQDDYTTSVMLTKTNIELELMMPLTALFP